MPEAARVYAEALFDVAKEKGKLDAIRERAGPVRRRRSTATASCRSSSSAPTSPRRRRSAGLKRAVSGADPELLNFLELLIEKQRMPEIFRIRRQLDELWKQENRRIDVTVTSAVELDPAVVEKVGEEIERQTGQKVELASRVDGEILGGIVLQVGNMVLDASIRSRLEKLRKSVAQAA